MKNLFTLLLTAFATFSLAQDKYDYIHYNNLTEMKATDYVIATIENRGKMLEVHNKYLLFINAKDGSSTQVSFPGDAFIKAVRQIKIDSLGINKVLVVAQTVNLDDNKSIDWNDPLQLIILSTDGREKTQLTSDAFFPSTWLIHRDNGSIIILGHYDSNNNGKLDKADKNEILVYDLKTMQMVSTI